MGVKEGKGFEKGLLFLGGLFLLAEIGLGWEKGGLTDLLVGVGKPQHT
jgi:hypothetical protein